MARSRVAVDLERTTVFLSQIGRRAVHERSYDRQRQDALREHHGAPV
jgi:hypothetical protein